MRTFAIETDPFKIKPLIKHLAANHVSHECAAYHAVIDYTTD
jgi:hypothetical protein